VEDDMAISQTYSRNTNISIASARPSLVLRAFGLLLDWQRRSRQRGQLAGMSDVALKDVGLSRADIAPEAQKPFWQA
jgi:uncharacterized protein YjiS (DUF1127 family)